MDSITDPTLAPILKSIRDEVEAQDNQWGGIPHDREHTHSDWLSYIEKQMGHIYRQEGDPQERYIKIAALCVSAIRASQSQGLQVRPFVTFNTPPPPRPFGQAYTGRFFLFRSGSIPCLRVGDSGHMKSPPSKQRRKTTQEFQVQRKKHLARAATDLALKHLRAGLSVTLKAFNASTGKWVLASVAPLVEGEEPVGPVLLIAGRIPQVGIPYDKDGRCCLSADKRYPWTEVEIRGRVIQVEPLS